MGRVYRARHVKVGRTVAIKVLHAMYKDVATIVERFERGGTIAARLRHPNLVSVLDVGHANGLPMLVMELAPGICLGDLAGEPMAGDRVVRLIAQLLHGLEHAHAAGLVHRDLKPDNVIVERTADGSEIPRIVDFGIAVSFERDTVVDKRLTEANTVIGTPYYMSPEQARGKDVDHRTDLFSLGVIMYELLSGTLPFDGSNVDVAMQNVSREAPSIAERAGIVVDPLLEAFVRRLMARKKTDRLQSARDAREMLALIERDRIAAARALTAPVVEPVPAVPVAPIVAPVSIAKLAYEQTLLLGHDSDRMATLDLPCVEDQPIDEEPQPARRRRGRLAGAVATTALAAVALVGLSLRQAAPASAPALEHSSCAPAEVALVATARVAMPASAPTHAHVASRSTPVVARVEAAPRPAVAPVVIAVTPPAPVARPAPVALPADITANDVIAKYVAVGKALKAYTGVDALWQRYRLIRINEAIATAEGKRSALLVLRRIEDVLATRAQIRASVATRE
jgi:serine/threonine-protein kinase